MTAEIAVLNRQGVALAADSAVTVSGEGSPKVFNTVNKLFMLSKHAPVGVMVYGNAFLTGTPWETIIKVYRRELGESRFGVLTDYADGLLEFLQRKDSLFPRAQQKQELHLHAYGYLIMLRDQMLHSMQQIIERDGEIKGGQVRRVVSEAAKAELTALRAVPFLDGHDAAATATLRSSYGSDISSIVEDVFEKLPLGKVTHGRLVQLVCEFFAREMFPNHVSGLVVAGFGEDEHFPQLVALDIQSVVNGRLKYRASNGYKVDATNHGALLPFAQREMVSLFMEGVDPVYRTTIQSALGTFIEGLPNALVEALPIPAASRAAVSRKLLDIGQQLLASFGEEVEKYARDQHTDPVLQTLSVLPKEELAAMAEALVNLTSFKRRVTMDAETVGGPIDVAVISKGDGFVWIKRKHYFDGSLNHHFFANYLR